MNTSYQGTSDYAKSLTRKLRLAAVSMPLLGIAGGTLRMLGISSLVSLGIIVPVFVVLFVVLFVLASGRSAFNAARRMPAKSR
jgi:hypothetical protein